MVGDGYYMSCADTAKLVRAALKKAFPGQRFSVRSHTYSGGASVHVDWTDGPQSADVDKIVKIYAGAGFDGMIDLKTLNSHWLYPGGHVEPCQREIGHSYGSTAYDGNGERVSEDDLPDYGIGTRIGAGVTNTIAPRDPGSLAYRRGLRDGKRRVEGGARLVHFGADYIFTHRDLSENERARLEHAVMFLGGEPGETFSPAKRYGFAVGGRWHEEYGSTLVHQMTHVARDDLAEAIRREADRRGFREVDGRRLVQDGNGRLTWEAS